MVHKGHRLSEMRKYRYQGFTHEACGGIRVGSPKGRNEVLKDVLFFLVI